jgi:hypothetical protein
MKNSHLGATEIMARFNEMGFPENPNTPTTLSETAELKAQAQGFIEGGLLIVDNKTSPQRARLYSMPSSWLQALATECGLLL